MNGMYPYFKVSPDSRHIQARTLDGADVKLDIIEPYNHAPVEKCTRDDSPLGLIPGERYVSLDAGGSGLILKPGGVITQTESPSDLSDLIGKDAFGDIGKGKEKE